MTLIICALAAIVVSIIRFAAPAIGAKWHLGALALMYASASLMWCVDGFFCLAEGEPFVELADAAAMTDDALLGACVVALGLLVWAVVLFVKRRTPAQAKAAA